MPICRAKKISLMHSLVHEMLLWEGKGGVHTPLKSHSTETAMLGCSCNCTSPSSSLLYPGSMHCAWQILTKPDFLCLLDKSCWVYYNEHAWDRMLCCSNLLGAWVYVLKRPNELSPASTPKCTVNTEASMTLLPLLGFADRIRPIVSINARR